MRSSEARVARAAATHARAAPREPAADAAGQALALVRSQAPLRRTLAALAGRLVETRGWERLGFARLADYARERLGLSARQVHELAHVHGALARLPTLERAFLSGALPWTKVRLLARIAEPSDETAWIAAAHQLSSAALAREVRAVDRAARGVGDVLDHEAEDVARENVAVRCTPDVRARWYRVRQLAQRVAGERLAPWQCAEAAVAEVLSGGVAPESEPDQPEPAPEGRASPARALSLAAPAPPATAAAQSEPSLPVFLVPLLDGLDEADPFDVDARLLRALRLERSSQARLGRLLLVIARERIHFAHGCRSMDEFAREHLGLSPRSAQALLRVERACARWPEFARAWRAAELTAEQAQALAGLTLARGVGRFAPAWVEHARHVTVRRLADDVDRALSAQCFDPARLATRVSWDRAEPAPAEVPAGPQMRAHPRDPRTSTRLFFNAPRDVARLFRATLAAIQRAIEGEERRVATESEALARLFDHALEAWSSLQDREARAHRIFERDGWRCTVPGCTSYRELHDHHVRFRAAGGSDDPANRTTLCAWHHLRGVHHGRVGCHGSAPDGLEFTLGIRPGREPLLRYRARPERLAS